MTDDHPVILTASDFALLDNFVHNWGEPFAGAGDLVRRKLAAATLVFPMDVPADVVTLNSRVRFRVGNAFPEERTLVGGPSEEIYGMTLVLASPRGLALIGAAAGQVVQARRPDGLTEGLLIEAVPYQPRQRKTPAILRVVSRQDMPETLHSLGKAGPRLGASRFRDDDDPGPSAA